MDLSRREPLSWVSVNIEVLDLANNRSSYKALEEAQASVSICTLFPPLARGLSRLDEPVPARLSPLSISFSRKTGVIKGCETRPAR